MKPLLFVLSAAAGLAEQLCRDQDMDLGVLERRQFPDGETYLRFATPVANRDVVILCTLDCPDDKTVPLLLAADAVRQQGARSVGLVAPYLAYMRQDKAFRPGEAVTSLTYARLLSAAFDWLVTVDPHLHRHPRLENIYSIPAVAAEAAGPIAEWIRANVERPVLIGPDEESAQWVNRIGALAGVPSTVFRKTRKGDRDVEVEGSGPDASSGPTPVIVDDIASSARTMIETVRLLRNAGHRPPVCIVVHPIFAGESYAQLIAAGAGDVVSTNAIAHTSNRIDLSAVIGQAIRHARARAVAQ